MTKIRLATIPYTKEVPLRGGERRSLRLREVVGCSEEGSRIDLRRDIYDRVTAGDKESVKVESLTLSPRKAQFFTQILRDLIAQPPEERSYSASGFVTYVQEWHQEGRYYGAVQPVSPVALEPGEPYGVTGYQPVGLELGLTVPSGSSGRIVASNTSMFPVRALLLGGARPDEAIASMGDDSEIVIGDSTDLMIAFRGVAVCSVGLVDDHR
jgi:hypothetical protein